MLQQPAGAASAPSRAGRPQRDAAPDAPPPLDPAMLRAILRRRLGPFLAVLLAVPLLAWLALSHLVPRYTASGTLLYDPSAYAAPELRSILRRDPINEAVMASQAEVLRGLTIAERVANELHLTARAEFNPALRKPGHLARLLGWLFGHRGPAGAPNAAVPGMAAIAGPSPDPARDAALRAVQAAITVHPLPNSRVLAVSFTAEDPVLAAAAANRVMDLYVKSQLGAKYRAIYRAREWLRGREAELRKEVRAQEDRIAAYRAAKGLVQGVHAGLATEQISNLNDALVHARSDLAAAEGRVTAARGMAGPAAQAAIAPNVVALRAQEDGLAAQLQSLLTRLGPNHPDVRALSRQLADTRAGVARETARVVAAAIAEQAADRTRVARLQQALAAAQSGIDRDGAARIPLDAMQRDADAARALLLAVEERVQQTAQQAAIETPDAHEISEALPPAHPSFPRTVPILAAAFASGLALALLLVYLLELADQTLRGVSDLRAGLGLSGFALIPEIGRRARAGLAITDYAALKPMSPFAEQVRALRAGLWLGGERPRIIAITAARPQEGKTTLAVALARLSAMAGERVVVLDGDVRRPALARLMREGAPEPGEASPAEPGIGLADLLAGDAALADVLRRDSLSGAAFIAAGAPRADMLALYGSAAMAGLLRDLAARFDLVLIDTPPVHAMTDARVLARIAEATLLCVRWHHTPRGVVLAALELLEEAGAHVVGAALTRIDARAQARAGTIDAEAYHPRYAGYFHG